MKEHRNPPSRSPSTEQLQPPLQQALSTQKEQRVREMTEEEKPRIIKLHCPSLAKTVPVVARAEQKLDLGSIARSFGLDPWSLKLNGHFISRGIDLISSSVTWSSLLSFFSAKGLSTGANDRNALIVDGKLLKSGTKRRQDEAPETTSPKEGGCRRRQLDDFKFIEPNKLREDCEFRQRNFDGLKRKPLVEDSRLMKKLKLSETAASGEEDGGNKNDGSSMLKILTFSCGSINERLKRGREDEAIETAPPWKRIR